MRNAWIRLSTGVESSTRHVDEGGEFAPATIASASNSIAAWRSFQLMLLTLAGMAAVYAKMALGPLQETMRTALALTDNQIALLQGPALVLPMLLAAIPIGLAVDRYSRARLLFVLAVLLMAGTLLTAIASNFALLLAARGVVGLAVFALLPVTGSLLADLYPPGQRGRASTVMLIGQFAAMSAAFAVGGTLVTMSDWGLDAWRWAMLWGIAPPLAFVILLMLALREPPRTGQMIESPSVRESFVEVWRYRAMIVPLLVGQVLAVISLQSLLIWATSALSRTFALAPDHVGAIMATVVPLGGISGSIAGGVLADRGQRTGGPRKTVSVASTLALLGVPLCLFIVMPEADLASVLLAGLVAILTAISVIGATLLIVAIPNEIRGLCLGLLTGIGTFLSIGFAPLLVSWLSGAIGGPAMIGKSLALICVTGSLLCAATYAFCSRYFPRASAQ